MYQLTSLWHSGSSPQVSAASGTAVDVIPGCLGIPGMNICIPEFPGMKKGVWEWIPYLRVKLNSESALIENVLIHEWNLL